jgi:cyanate lyase
LGLTLKDVVRRSGTAESTITGALYGYHEGNIRTWRAIAHALNMGFGSLMDHINDPGV